MKTKTFLLAVAFLFSAQFVDAQEAITVVEKITNVKSTASNVELTWDQQTHDFGEILQGIPAKATFQLTNTTNQPLVITKVKGSCGCTATAHEETPIFPGETTSITATYNAMKTGVFTKSVRVTTSLEETPVLLKIKGEVLVKK